MNTFQDQEYDEETGWVQFKWRNHMPELGRFFNVDPLAEDYYYNSPYAFSENNVVAHIELEGLEKIFFMNSLKKNNSFKKTYEVQRQTSGGKSFDKKLKSQSKLNVLYFTHSGKGTAFNTKITSVDQLDKLQQGYFGSAFKSVTKKAATTAMGKEGLILIGIKDGELEDLVEGAATLNHEEHHAESTLDGNEQEDKNELDHESYYGEKRWDSPSNEKVKNDPKYQDTKAKQQLDEILRIVNDAIKAEKEKKDE